MEEGGGAELAPLITRQRHRTHLAACAAALTSCLQHAQQVRGLTARATAVRGVVKAHVLLVAMCCVWCCASTGRCAVAMLCAMCCVLCAVCCVLLAIGYWLLAVSRWTWRARSLGWLCRPWDESQVRLAVRGRGHYRCRLATWCNLLVCTLHVNLCTQVIKSPRMHDTHPSGRVDVEDVLDVIFRDFCIGK